MDTKPIMAWHFCGEALRDGRPIPANGEMLRQEGPIIPCESGLHGSERLIDALKYAPGETLCRVRLGGEMVPHNGDKYAASERVILWRFNAAELLRLFARLCASDVIHLWNAPSIVRQSLETGREDIRDAAGTAAWDASCAAYADAYAARAAHAVRAARAAHAARAARAAYAGASAAYAAHAAEKAGAYAAGAAHAAANAAWATAWDAAWDVPSDVARDASWATARTTAEDAQNEKLTTMTAMEATRLGYGMESVSWS